MLDARGVATQFLFASRSTLRGLLATAAFAAALGAGPQAFAQDAAQVESGFALTASLGARYGILTTVTAGGGALPAVTPLVGLTLGYKTGRIMIGVGLEFNNTTTNNTMCAGGIGTCGTAANPETSTTVSGSNFLIGPDFQFAIIRSADQRVELIGDAALHFGHQFNDTTVSITPSPPPPPPNNAPTESNFLLSYRIGPGVRFWAHKHFAFQATTGFGGQAYFDIPIPNVPANGNNSQHGIYATFGAMGVF
jgi:hypothetical protein